MTDQREIRNKANRYFFTKVVFNVCLIIFGALLISFFLRQMQHFAALQKQQRSNETALNETIEILTQNQDENAGHRIICQKVRSPEHDMPRRTFTNRFGEHRNVIHAGKHTARINYCAENFDCAHVRAFGICVAVDQKATQGSNRKSNADPLLTIVLIYRKIKDHCHKDCYGEQNNR